LKVVRRDAADPESLARFERERALATELGIDKGFVPLLASGTSELGPYYVMPFFGSGDLRRRLRLGPLAVEDAIALAIALARALGRAHERGIVHRDLKPENVFFTDDGRPLVADLGLGKRVRAASPGSLTASNEVLGTPGYMAPEQAESMRAAGPPADVFALGAILYECLAGARPFAGASFVEVFGRVARGQFPPLATLRSGVPRAVVRIVERCLDKAPSKRPRDGHALAAELEAARRSRRRLPGLALAGLAVLAAGTLVVLAARGSTSKARPAPGPGPSVALRVEAEEALASGDPRRAIALASRAVEADPRDARAFAVRGQAHLLRLETAAGLADASRALAIEPELAWALAVRSGARIFVDRKAAVADAERACAREPDSPWALMARARLLSRDRRAEGRATFDRAARLAPRNVCAQLGSIEGSEAAQDFARALADVERELGGAPRCALLLACRGRLRTNRGEFARAHEDLDAALASDPDAPYVLRLRVDLFRREGNVAAAQAELDRALAIGPREPLLLEQRAAILLRSGDDKGAAAAFEDVIALMPEVSSPHAFLGMALEHQGELDRALAEETRAIELDDENAWNWSNRAGIRLLRRDVPGAITDATRALEIDHWFRDALLIRARARAAQGDRALALDDLRRYREAIPPGPEGDDVRAQVDALMKSFDGGAAPPSPR